MKRVENSLWLFLIISIVLKYLNIELIHGLAPVIVALSGTIGTLYMSFALAYFNGLAPKKTIPMFDFAGISKFRYGMSIYFGLVFMMLIYSVLFKLLFWPGKNFLGRYGLLATIIGVAVLLYFEKDKESIFYNRIINRAVWIGLFAFVFYIASVNNLVDLQWRNYPKYAEAKKKYLKDWDNLKLRQEADKILEQERQERKSSSHN